MKHVIKDIKKTAINVVLIMLDMHFKGMFMVEIGAVLD